MKQILNYQPSADAIDAIQRRLNWRLALKRLDYVRRLELGAADNLLDLQPGMRILDAASGYSPWPFYLAIVKKCTVTSFDLSESVEWQHATWQRSRTSEGTLSSERQDARKLDYPKESFQVVTAISAIEHIEGDGDQHALKEFSRVLEPSGRLLISLPVDLRGGGGFYKDHNIYSKHYTDQPVFYKHNYDEVMLDNRILIPAARAGLKLVRKIFFGEPGFNYFNRIYTNERIPLAIRALFFQFTPLASHCFLKITSIEELKKTRYPQRIGTANGIILLWEKSS